MRDYHLAQTRDEVLQGCFLYMLCSRLDPKRSLIWILNENGLLVTINLNSIATHSARFSEVL